MNLAREPIFPLKPSETSSSLTYGSFMAVHGAVYWIARAEVLFRLGANFDLSVSSFLDCIRLLKNVGMAEVKKFVIGAVYGVLNSPSYWPIAC